MVGEYQLTFVRFLRSAASSADDPAASAAFDASFRQRAAKLTNVCRNAGGIS
jgi:hypothetical protein